MLAVVVATYFLADRYSKPIKMLKEALGEIGQGRFDHRIEEKRKDEFGELFEAFDGMAEALQGRSDSGETITPPDTPAPAAKPAA